MLVARGGGGKVAWLEACLDGDPPPPAGHETGRKPSVPAKMFKQKVEIF